MTVAEAVAAATAGGAAALGLPADGGDHRGRGRCRPRRLGRRARGRLRAQPRVCATGAHVGSGGRRRARRLDLDRRRGRIDRPIMLRQWTDTTWSSSAPAPAGEAAASKARQRGASVAIVDRDLFGGACPFFACMPSQVAAPFRRGACRRRRLPVAQGVGAPRLHDQPRGDATIPMTPATSRTCRRPAPRRYAARARLDGPGRVIVRHDDDEHELEAGAVIVAVGSTSKVPDMPGLADVPYWTNREATASARAA